MAEAVLSMLSAPERETDIAQRVNVTPEDLRRWRKIYTEAGLKALAELRSPG
jgi:transposase-like protein